MQGSGQNSTYIGATEIRRQILRHSECDTDIAIVDIRVLLCVRIVQ